MPITPLCIAERAERVLSGKLLSADGGNFCGAAPKSKFRAPFFALTINYAFLPQLCCFPHNNDLITIARLLALQRAHKGRALSAAAAAASFVFQR